MVTCSSAGRGGRTRTRGLPGAAPAARPPASTPRRRRRRSSRRRAAPRRRGSGSRRGSGRRSSRVRCRASMHISSASSMKSATRPACSSVWLKASPVAGHLHVGPELLRGSPGSGPAPCAGPPRSAPCRSMSHISWPSSRWKEPAVRLPLMLQQLLRPARCTPCSASTAAGWLSSTLSNGRVGEVVADRGRQHEVAVGQALHQRAGAEPVGAVVGEVGLADHEQAGDRGLQVVVDPQAAHRVVDGRVDAHRRPRRGPRR